jgi:hypothetical protein
METQMATNRESKPTSQPASALKDQIEVGFHVFTADGGEEVGAVRDVTSEAIVVYVENAGDFEVSVDAVSAVHSQKVVLNCSKLDATLRSAIGHAHDDEVPGL